MPPYGLRTVCVVFTVRFGLPSIPHRAEMFAVIRSAPETDVADITPVQAVAVYPAWRVGTGKLAGAAGLALTAPSTERSPREMA